MIQVLSLVFLFAQHLSFAAVDPAKVQIIQSIPVETDLAQKDLVFAKDCWIEMFQNAKSNIDLGEFYIANEPGSDLETVIVELEKAAKRGVKIRMLLSNTMLKNDLPSYERIKAIPGAEVKIYDLSKITGGILHAKYFVVDGQFSYVGSQNFDWRALTHIHETGIKINNIELAAQLTSIFNIDWKIAETGQPPTILPTKTSAPQKAIEIVASPAQFNPQGTRYSLDALLELINTAKKSVRFQLLSYSIKGGGKQGTWTDIDNALRAAAARGVKIQIMVADWNTGSPDLENHKSLASVPNIEFKIITIPPFSAREIQFGRVIHSKVMTVDDSVLWVGTSNWSKGYFADSRNIEVILRDSKFAAIGSRIFNTLWSSQYGVNVKDYTKPPVKP